MLQYGHINFDLIHINALRSQGFDVKVVVFACIAQKISLPKDILLFTIPDWLDCNTSNGIINRIMYILSLLYIRMHVCAKDYDRVVVSNIDEISLFIVPPSDRMLLFTHSPHDIFRSRVKSYFTRRLARNNTFLVFNDNMKVPFHNAGIDNVKVISHGCMPPYKYDKATSIENYIKDGQRLLFHPSHRPNQRFVAEILSDNCLQKVLEDADAVLIIRDKSGLFNSKGRIRIISDYLFNETYQNIFLRAEVIILAYPDDFLYKVSGVSYECLANKKRMLILDNPSFFYCREFFDYDPMFSTVGGFIEKLKELLDHQEYRCIAGVDALIPNYPAIFE